MDWSGHLKAELRERAARWVDMSRAVSYNSHGLPGTVLFPAQSDSHGNFFGEAWSAIAASSSWSGRLGKAHSQSRHLPQEHRAEAKELDSSNSSDALLMNCFCYPGAAVRLAAAIGASPVGARPEFGVSGYVRLTGGAQDTTELDMVLGDTIVEAKLTERDFTARPKHRVLRYADLTTVFDVDLLPGDVDSFSGYKLIRNVLAAAQHERRLVVLIDLRRPALLHEWWAVHSAIRSGEMRVQCQLRFWQEIAKAAEPAHQKLLEVKYGLWRRERVV